MAKKWYNHFSSLLGEAPNIEDEDEEFEAVLLGIAIDDVFVYPGRVSQSTN